MRQYVFKHECPYVTSFPRLGAVGGQMGLNVLKPESAKFSGLAEVFIFANEVLVSSQVNE